MPPIGYQTQRYHKFLLKSKRMMSYKISLQCLPVCNKLCSTHHSCLVSVFTISCCTVFLTFHRFSIWSLYLFVYFIYHTLKGNFTLWYYLRKKSECQILFEISGVKFAVYFCTKKYSTWALGRFDADVIRVNTCLPFNCGHIYDYDKCFIEIWHKSCQLVYLSDCVSLFTNRKFAI